MVFRNLIRLSTFILIGGVSCACFAAGLPMLGLEDEGPSWETEERQGNDSTSLMPFMVNGLGDLPFLAFDDGEEEENAGDENALPPLAVFLPQGDSAAPKKEETEGKKEEQGEVLPEIAPLQISDLDALPPLGLDSDFEPFGGLLGAESPRGQEIRTLREMVESLTEQLKVKDAKIAALEASLQQALQVSGGILAEPSVSSTTES